MRHCRLLNPARRKNVDLQAQGAAENRRMVENRHNTPTAETSPPPALSLFNYNGFYKQTPGNYCACIGESLDCAAYATTVEKDRSYPVLEVVEAFELLSSDH